MAKLTLPIPSPVPLDVLRKDTLSIIEEMYDSGNAGFVGVRLMNGCQNAGLDRLWMLATIGAWVLLKRKNLGKKTLRLAEEVLKKSGCSFQMFPELRMALEEAATLSGKSSNRQWLSISEVFMALDNFGSWAKDEAIIAALAEHGLRPGMPIEELFVYVPAVTEPTDQKKLTVAEEIAAFLGAKVSVLHSGPLPEVTKALITEETTVGECAMIVLLARMQSSQHTSGLDACARVLNILAHRCLGPAAREMFGITDE